MKRLLFLLLATISAPITSNPFDSECGKFIKILIALSNRYGDLMKQSGGLEDDDYKTLCFDREFQFEMKIYQEKQYIEYEFKRIMRTLKLLKCSDQEIALIKNTISHNMEGFLEKNKNDVTRKYRYQQR